MRPEPRDGGWCRPVSSARSTISMRRVWNRIPGSVAATPRYSTIPPPGVLHNEALGAASGVWAVASYGWVQESWPRAMKEACPDLALPPDLPVNEKQTATAFDRMMAQDTDAPLARISRLRTARARRHRHRRLGRASAPAGGGPQALPRRQQRPGAHRQYRCAPRSGTRSGPRRAVGCSTAMAVPAQSPIPAISSRHRTAREIALHYERLPLRPRFRIGDALPLLPTGERYAAMRADRLAGGRAAPR